MIKLFIMAALWLSLSNLANGQALKIGDKVPDFNIGKILNYPKESLKFSNIKARLVIIDYWSTWCSSCIAAMPKMNALQKQFVDKILIVPATGQNEETIRPFWEKNKYLNSTSLPTIVNDTLNKYFPHAGVPYHVWILDGKVFAMPDPGKANEKDISHALAGKAKDWALGPASPERHVRKQQAVVDFSGRGNDTSYAAYYSVLAKSDGLITDGYDNFKDEHRLITRFMLRNLDLISLFRGSIGLSGTTVPNATHLPMQPNKRVLEVENVGKYYPLDQNSSAEWNRDHSYNYEVVLPGKVSKADIGNMIIADLRKLFGLNARIEKRKTECWIISMMPGVKKIKSDKIIPPNLNFIKERDLLIEKYGGASPELSAFLKKEGERHPGATTSVKELLEYLYINFVDETGYTEQFNIYLKLKGQKFEDYKSAMNRYGFELTKGVREIDMFVLTENDYQAKLK